MKKIAIVSCYFQKNYGSMLQAFATKQIIQDLGYECETVCIDGIKNQIRNAKLKHYFLCAYNLNIFKSKIGYIKKYYHQLFDAEFRRNSQIRNSKFMEFQIKHFNLSETYKSWQELKEACKNYTSVLVGSDQLWLPSNIAADYYTLTFVPDDVNKISYATSFGVADLPESQYYIAQKFLNRIQHLSVRETSGKKIIRNICGRNAEVVCDPTLLLNAEQWNKHFPQEALVKDAYIFCYFLGGNLVHRKFANELKKITGYKIVALLHLDSYVQEDEMFVDKSLYNVGPAEFVNLIRGASYVLTDSFHGTVFSILYRKQFFCFKRFLDKSSVSTNTRIENIIEYFQLKKRFDPNLNDFKKEIYININYKLIEKKAEEMRLSSLKFLVNALKGEENDNN